MAKKNFEENGGNWMDTYGDMVTLLLTFFVMLYSMSSVEEDKWAMLVRAFNIHGDEVVDQIVLGYSSDTGGTEPFQNTGNASTMGPQKHDPVNSELDNLFINIQQYVEDNNMQESISVRQGESEGEMGTNPEAPNVSDKPYSEDGEKSKNIYIQFNNNVLFKPDEAVLKDDSYEVMKFLGECLKKVEPDIALIIIKGHTAISPTSIVDSRLLSSDRASTISNYLENKYKMPSTKLYPIGLSGDYPVASNENEEGRSKNRRVEIVIIGKNSDLAKSGELLKILGASFDTGIADIDNISGN